MREIRALQPHLVQSTLDRSDHVQKRLIAIRPRRDRAAVPRRREERAEREILPVARPENDGNHTRLAYSVPLHRASHLPFVTIVRRNEIGANQKQDDIRRVEMAVDRVGEFGAGRDASVVPRRYDALSLQGDEVLFQLIAQVLVSMGV